MALFMALCNAFWKNVEKNDIKNIASQTEPEGIKRIYDIAYIDDGHPLHRLDVYYPENTEGKLPVIIDIHGGGWMYGNKELNRIYCLNLAKRGYTVFNMSYRLVPEVTVYDQLKDVMAAIDYIAKHLEDYPCDANNIMLTGDSAGKLCRRPAYRRKAQGNFRHRRPGPEAENPAAHLPGGKRKEQGHY